jgi:hypothetical protein
VLLGKPLMPIGCWVDDLRVTTTSDVDATRTKDATVRFQRKPWQKPNGGFFIYIAVMVTALLANFAWLVNSDVHSFVIGIAFCVPGFLIVAGVIAFGPPVLVNGEVDGQGVRGTTWWGKTVAVSWDDMRQGVLRVPRNRPTDPPFALVLHPRTGRSCMIAIPKDSYPPDVRLALDALRLRRVEILNLDRYIEV